MWPRDASPCARPPGPLTLKKGWVLISSASCSPPPQALLRALLQELGEGGGLTEGTRPQALPTCPGSPSELGRRAPKGMGGDSPLGATATSSPTPPLR